MGWPVIVKETGYGCNASVNAEPYGRIAVTLTTRQLALEHLADCLRGMADSVEVEARKGPQQP